MAEIGSSANSLLSIITDLLDAAKLDNGSVEIHISDVDGGAVAAEVPRHFDHRLGTTGNVPQPTRGNVAAVTPRVHVTLDLHRRTSQTPWHRCRCA